MSIPGSLTPLFSTGAAAGGYQIERSLRFNSADSAYLSRTPAVAGNRRTWTWAGWVKRSVVSSAKTLFSGRTDDSNRDDIGFSSGGSLFIEAVGGTGTVPNLVTTPVFRDPSAWYHVVIAVDTTIASPSSDRVKIYVNDSQITTFSSSTYPSQNFNFFFNNNNPNYIGVYGYTTLGNYFSGYLADIHFIDGQALTPSSFTEVSATTGQLIPKAYAGTYTGNSFWLKFNDNSAATATTLGKDSFLLGNNWTPNNLLATQAIAAPFSVFGLSSNSTEPITNIGSLTQLATNVINYSTVGVLNCVTADFGSVGSWVIYAQTFLNDPSFTGTIGISNNGTSWTSVSVGQNPFVFTGRYIQWARSGSGYGTQTLFSNLNDSDSLVDTPTSYGTPDTGVGNEVRGNYATFNPLSKASVATLSNGNLDASFSGSSYPHLGSDATIALPSSGKWYWEITVTTVGELWTGIRNVVDGKQSTYYRDGSGGFNNIRIEASSSTGSANAASYTSGDIIGVAINCDGSTIAWYKNGSQVGTTYSLTNVANLVPFAGHASTSGSAVCVANFGQRAFAYTAPSGFKALCDTNLGAPVVALPNTVMDVALYTGNGSTQTISGLNFSPDWVWIKARNFVNDHKIYDIVRGATKVLESSNTSAESTDVNSLTAFNSDGFNLGTAASTNANTTTYVAWTWDAGTTTDPSNQAGSITSQVRANASAGFSVVTYTGTGSGTNTVGHGLGAAPGLIIVKARDASFGWRVYHSSLGATKILLLNSTSAEITNSQYWNNTSPTSNVFTAGTDPNSANNYVAYCFAPVVGYSSFGSYTGNGSTDGPFVHLGFLPRWILFKKSSASQSWHLIDTARDPYNIAGNELYPDLSLQESGGYGNVSRIDVVSNGFKIRTSNDGYNGSAGTYIYAAFAQNSFQYSRAR